MDTQTSEQALRYEAVLRRALGHRVCDICRDLARRQFFNGCSPCDKDKNLYDTVGYLLFLGFM
jgi:hypothetical protein